MPIIIPYIPRTITVHLGLPDQWAENVTVDFQIGRASCRERV